MANPLLLKLERFTRLSADDQAAILRAAGDRVRRLGPRSDLLLEGDRPLHLNLLMSGWACRYKQLADGRRQIVAFFLPGDLCDLNIYILREMDHSVGTLTPATVSEIARSAIDELTLHHPRVTQALWWETLVNASIHREWIVNIGQRAAFERIGHLLCELFIRLRTVGLTREDSCDFPLTQTELAEASGLSTVHVNRTLQELRRRA